MLLLTTLVIAPAVSGVTVYDQPRQIIRPLDGGNGLGNNILSYLLGKSLKETLEVFTRLSRQYESRSAEQVVALVEEAIAAEVYNSPLEYVNTMKRVAELEKEVGFELEEQVKDTILKYYQVAVDNLIRLITKITDGNLFSSIARIGALRVAIMQFHVCKAAKQMF